MGVQEMWDFSFELPALLLIGIILAAYFSTKHLPTRQNRFYLQMTGVCIVCGITNILSGWLDSRYGSLWTGPALIVLEIVNLIFLYDAACTRDESFLLLSACARA